MYLTPSYSSITAVFDSPVDLEKYPAYEGSQEFNFSVGAYHYNLTIEHAHIKGMYDISFGIDSFRGTDEQKKELIRKWTGQTWEEIQSGDLILSLNDYFSRLLYQRSVGIIGGSSATQVFSHVIAAVKEHLSHHDVYCYRFTGIGDSHNKFYHALARYFEKLGARVNIKSDQGSRIKDYWVFPPLKKSQVSARRWATNYSVTKDFARNLIYFFTQGQSLLRRVETDTRRYLNELKPEDD